MNPVSQEIEDEMVKTLAYTVRCANYYFRTLRNHGVFVPHDVRLMVVAAGKGMTASRHAVSQCTKNYLSASLACKSLGRLRCIGQAGQRSWPQDVQGEAQMPHVAAPIP